VWGALPDPAAAWRAPGAGETDLRRYALAHAILAPNPHNRQPWLVDLVGEDELLLFVDLDRRLPATDPFDRQITMGCGAFLELFDLSIRERGRRAEIALWPEGEPQPRLDARPIARVRITGDAAEKDPLFAHILTRRTNREPYEDREVPTNALMAIARSGTTGQTDDREAAALEIAVTNGGTLRDQLRALAWNSFEREFRTPHAHMETVNLMRVGATEIAMERDGIAIRGAFVDFARRVGLVNKRTLADIGNPITKQGLEAWRPLALDAPAFIWISSFSNPRTEQISAGRAYARLNLAATGQGLAMHPWSQALQEYREMAELHAEAERLMSAPDDARVQMLARVGYAVKDAPPAPRRGLDALFAREPTAPSSQ
jgi:nitroreductase